MYGVGVIDGKTVGAFIEYAFRAFLAQKYDFELDNSAKGIDLPVLNIDIKITSCFKASNHWGH